MMRSSADDFSSVLWSTFTLIHCYRTCNVHLVAVALVSTGFMLVSH